MSDSSTAKNIVLYTFLVKLLLNNADKFYEELSDIGLEAEKCYLNVDVDCTICTHNVNVSITKNPCDTAYVSIEIPCKVFDTEDRDSLATRIMWELDEMEK